MNMKPGDLVTLKTYGSQFPTSPYYRKIYTIKEIKGDIVVLLGVMGWVYQSEVNVIHETG